MKVKLLKKVRKRYEIIRIVKINNPNSPWYGVKTPIYELIDNSGLRWPMVFDSFPEAHSALIDIIRKDYYHTKETDDTAMEKVWCPKSNK